MCGFMAVLDCPPFAPYHPKAAQPMTPTCLSPDAQTILHQLLMRAQTALDTDRDTVQDCLSRAVALL